MRQLIRGGVVAAIALLVSSVALAGNQETADQIARNLRESGKLSDYKVGVKFQDGTAWLVGRVRNEEQMTQALRIAFATPGVSRVVNNLDVSGQQAAAAPETKWLGRPNAPAQTAQSTRLNVADTPERLEQATGAMAPERVHRTSVEQVAAMQPAAMQPVPAQPVVQQPEDPRPLPVQRAVAKPAAPSRNSQRPIPVAYTRQAGEPQPTPAMPEAMPNGAPQPMYSGPVAAGPAPMRYDQPHLPNYAWPGYAAYPNYAALTYPRQYSPTVWPYIGPFYPYPQVPLGWRKVTLEWDDGWWWLDFKNTPSRHRSPVGRHY
jgi:hypothetical protein